MRTERFVRSEEGAALVEFALVVLILLMIVYGIVDFGRALFIQNNLTSAVREGARFASVQVDPGNEAAVEARVMAYIVGFGGAPVDAGMIAVTLDQAVPNTEYVTVSLQGYPFEPVTPLASLVSIDTVSFSATATFRWERAP